MQPKRLILFVLMVALLIGVWWGGRLLFPPPEPTPTINYGFWDVHRMSEWAVSKKPLREGALHAALGPWDMDQLRAAAVTRKELPNQAVNAVLFPWDLDRMRLMAHKSLSLGSDDTKSKFHLHVVLDSRGGAVRRVLLNKFKATDGKTGKPTNDLLILVPDPTTPDPENPDQSLKNTALMPLNNVLYHFTGKDGHEEPLNPQARPVVTLGQIDWKADVLDPDEVTDKEVKRLQGKRVQRQRVRFTTEIDGVEITKVYSLLEGEYHLDLEVSVRRLDKEPRKFRYQLTGSRGLPIEGRWYTGTFRNALLGSIDPKNYVSRDLQTSAQIGNWEGGNTLQHDADHPDFIRYAGIANQYFASTIVVEKDQPNQKFISRARPTLEKSLVKGEIESVDSEKLVLVVEKKKETFYFEDLRPSSERIRLQAGKKIALLHFTDPQGRLDSPTNPQQSASPREIISKLELDEPDKFHPVWEDDITVRVDTEVMDLKDDEPVVHKYLLYNGPVKPRLLGYIDAEKGGVTSELVEYYEDHGLDTMTDFHSPGWPGRIAGFIQWTWLIIKCTNVMHWVLHKISWVIPSLGLSIICLTILVRGMMFPVSRQGAMTSIRMQELAPELKKLSEKYKDDPQARGLAQMELYKKHGIKPLGTCWFMFLQMPIFMGLYFALQESITFRLASFQPLGIFGMSWIENLAAPDMLFSWGDSIPVISAPESYGGMLSFLYLGPYLNVLPILAVSLMIMQQKLITPPPTDEQQEMQQKMMKYMMVFMGLMFYKVAAGLCIYFIASSLWGFAERKLLPKKKKPAPGGETTTPSTSASLLSRVMGGNQTDGGTAVTTEAPAKGRGRRRGKDRSMVAPEVPEVGGSPLQRVRRWFRRKREGLSEWWAEVLKQAAKKQR